MRSTCSEHFFIVQDIFQLASTLAHTHHHSLVVHRISSHVETRSEGHCRIEGSWLATVIWLRRVRRAISVEKEHIDLLHQLINGFEGTDFGCCSFSQFVSLVTSLNATMTLRACLNMTWDSMYDKGVMMCMSECWCQLKNVLHNEKVLARCGSLREQVERILAVYPKMKSSAVFPCKSLTI